MGGSKLSPYKNKVLQSYNAKCNDKYIVPLLCLMCIKKMETYMGLLKLFPSYLQFCNKNVCIDEESSQKGGKKERL